MRTFCRNLLLAMLLIAGSALVVPYLEGAIYGMQLASMTVPPRFAMPVSKVQAGSLRDSWQVPRDGGRRRHEGIDIFAARGTPVVAATEGILMRLGSTRIGGNVVWVLGPGGQRHYYAHLDRFAWIHAGMRIEAGTVLGYVGTSGNAAGTPPHLHYGLYTAAGAINPFPYLRPAGA